MADLRIVMVFIALFANSIRGQEQIPCPDEWEEFMLYVPDILEMEEAAHATQPANWNQYDPRPFFDVSIRPNNNDVDPLDGFFGGSNYIDLKGKDSYFIEASKPANYKFLLRYVMVNVRYTRVPHLFFYTKESGREPIYDDRYPIEMGKTEFQPVRWPHQFSNMAFYNSTEISSLKIAFKTTAGSNDFLIRNLIVGTCIPAKVV